MGQGFGYAMGVCTQDTGCHADHPARLTKTYLKNDASRQHVKDLFQYKISFMKV